MKKADRLSELLKRFETYEDYWRDIYERGQDDVEFAIGNSQWPSKIKELRKKQNRPCLTENRMLPFVNQVINNIRQTRPSIIPRPVDSNADIKVAEILRGVVRNIETTSDADTVYDTGARNSVMSGVGWIRVCTDYAGYDTFDQEIRLERIQDFSSIYLDPNHKRQDGSDARDVFVFTEMDREEFEYEFPDAKNEGFPQEGGWCSEQTVRVCEYFHKEYEDRELVEFQISTIAGVIKGIKFREDVPTGAQEIRSRKTCVCTIKYCKFTGVEILEENTFPGEYLPIVPIYGFEVFSENKRTFYSLIHQGKDPQRMLNFWRSASTEVFALQPKAPYVGAVGQFNTYAQQWADANSENYATLEYDPVTIIGANGETIMLPAPVRQPPPTPSPALMQEAVGAAEAIKATLGMYDASLGNQTPDISGKAIISRQMQGDNATFHFIDNLSISIRHVGRILIGLIPLIYTGNRIVRILGEDGTEKMVPINQPVVEEGGNYRLAADGEVADVIRFDAGKYDVVVEVGPSYGTKRQELANAIVEIARVNPNIMTVAGDLFMKSLDVPNAEEIAKRIRATMDPALLGDDVEAARVQQLTQAMGQLQEKLALTEQALLAKQTNEEFKNSLEAKKVENDTVKLKIEAAKTEAEIEKIRSEIHGIPGEALGLLSSAITQLKAQADDVSGALDVLLSAKEEEGSLAPPEMVPVNEGNSYVGRDIGSDQQQ